MFSSEFLRKLYFYGRLMYPSNACNNCNMNQEYVCTMWTSQEFLCGSWRREEERKRNGADYSGFAQFIRNWMNVACLQSIENRRFKDSTIELGTLGIPRQLWIALTFNLHFFRSDFMAFDLIIEICIDSAVTFIFIHVVQHKCSVRDVSVVCRHAYVIKISNQYMNSWRKLFRILDDFPIIPPTICHKSADNIPDDCRVES